MLHSILTAPWQQASDVLSAGQPPMIARIMAINTLFFVLFLIRRMRGVTTMPERTAILVQSTLVGCNLMILFQDEIVFMLHKVI